MQQQVIELPIQGLNLNTHCHEKLSFLKETADHFCSLFTNGQLMEPVNDKTGIPLIQTCFPSSFHHTSVCTSKSNPFTTKCGH